MARVAGVIAASIAAGLMLSVAVPRQVCTTAPAPSAATQCTTQTIYENRTTAYQVVYEYAGKQYSVQLPQDPGPTLKLRISVEPVRGQPAPVALGEAVDASAVAVAVAPVASAAVPSPAMSTTTVIPAMSATTARPTTATGGLR